VSIPVEHLRAAGLGDEVERLSTTVAQYLDEDKELSVAHSNVAVISDPFAGREALLDYAEELLDDAERVRLSEVVTNQLRVPDLPEDGSLILDDCQYLFQRTVGGFEVLDWFLERLAMSNALVITSWNRYAWEYLAAVREVGESFPLQIRIPRLNRAQIEAVVSTYIDEAVRFVDAGEAGHIKTVNLVRKPIGLPGGRSVAVPFLKLNTAWVLSWFTQDEIASIEAVVYEKLRRVSHGNPGIATTIWEQSVVENDEGVTIAPGYIQDPIKGFELADDERAFLLLLIASFEQVSRESLDEMTKGISVDKELQTLVSSGIIDVDEDVVRIRPEGVHPSVAELTRRRLLW
jgi:hypothetical protein